MNSKHGPNPHHSLQTPQRPLLAENAKRSWEADSFPSPPLLQQETLGKVERLLKLICSVAGADGGGLARLSREGELLEHATYYSTGASTEAIDSIKAIHDSPWPSPFLGLVLQRQGMTYLTDPDQAADHECVPILALPDSIVILSLAATGGSRGVAYFVRASGRPAFGPREEKSLHSFHAWLEQESLLEESPLLTKLRVLNQVAQVTSNERSLPDMIDRSLHELERYFPLHVHSVWLVDSEGTNELPEAGEGEANIDFASLDPKAPTYLVLADNKTNFAVRSAKLGLRSGWRLAATETPFAPCLNGESAFYADLRQPRKPGSPLCEQLAERGVFFFFAVPLRAGKRTVGTLQIVSTCPEGFTNEHVQTIYLVADLLGPAISNCQLVLRLRAAYQHLRATQDKLVHTEKMRALGELASGVAHNFNNSLCSVLGFLEIAMLDPSLPPSCRRHLEASRLGALDAAEIVHRVQAFAEPRQEGMGFEPLDVSELVQGAVERTRPKWESARRARAHPIEVGVEAKAAAVINGTPGELREVLTNLIFNAVDAMPQGGHLTLHTWNTATDVFVSVQDTGVGMSEFVQQRVFEPMFTTKGQHGTGLGLSISFAIVHRHGGDITVASTIGKGSTFTVRLPLIADKRANQQKVQPASAPLAAPLGRRVLVIEDETAVRSFLEAALISLGYRPSLAADGEAGLDLFAKEPFDLVLTDVGLPGITGEDVARRIAQIAPEIPVVLLTGWADKISTQPGAVEGVRRVLGKPIQINTLAATLAELLLATRIVGLHS